MLKKTYRIFFMLLLIGTANSILAQHTKVYFGLGWLHNTFQDARFSDIQFNQSTAVPELGFSLLTEKNYWHANASLFSFEYEFPNADTITFTNLAYNVRFGYLKPIQPSFYLGFNWDIIDYYKRQTSFLENGADAYKLSSDFYISGKYLWDVTEEWQFNLGLDLGLFSFINQEPSFSANYQQNIIDNGNVAFIDEEVRRPYKLNNMAFKPFWELFNIRTMIELNYKRRFGLYYAWDLRTFADQKGYPVTNARHMLTLRYNFTNHVKSQSNAKP